MWRWKDGRRSAPRGPAGSRLAISVRSFYSREVGSPVSVGDALLEHGPAGMLLGGGPAKPCHPAWLKEPRNFKTWAEVMLKR